MNGIKTSDEILKDKTSLVNPESCRKKHLQILTRYFKIQTNRKILSIYSNVFLIFPEYIYIFFLYFEKLM